jgi:hypothetical protein
LTRRTWLRFGRGDCRSDRPGHGGWGPRTWQRTSPCQKTCPPSAGQTCPRGLTISGERSWRRDQPATRPRATNVQLTPGEAGHRRADHRCPAQVRLWPRGTDQTVYEPRPNRRQISCLEVRHASCTSTGGPGA